MVTWFMIRTECGYFLLGMVDDYGKAAQFQIENSSREDISVTTEDVSVNDYMMSTLFVCKVKSGKKAIDNMELLYLDDFRIDKVTKIDLTFKIYDPETYDDIDVSENITLIPE